MERKSSSEYSAARDDLRLKTPQEFKAKKGKARLTLYGQLFRYPLAVAAMVPATLQGLTPISCFLLFGRVLNALSAYKQTGDVVTGMKDLKEWTLYFVLLSVLCGICSLMNTFLWIRVGSRFTNKLKYEMFANLMRSDVAYLDTTPIGGILTLLGEDAQIVQDNFGIIKGQQFKCLGQFLGGIICGFCFAWKLALVALCIVPWVIGVMLFIASKIHIWINLKFRHTAESMTIAQETLSAIRTVRGFNREDAEFNRFVKTTRKVEKEDRITRGLICLMMNVVFAGLWALLVGDMYFGCTLADKGEMLPGDVISVYGFIMFGSMGLIELQSQMQAERRAISAGSRILGLIRHVPEIPYSGGERIENFKGHIEFKNVSFKYPSRDVYVLKNVSLEVKPGQMAALVGHSGSGKSTCVQLLERFYDVTEGQILLDGKDIRDLDPQWLHEQIGLVAQEPILFHTSIKDNIKYGKHDATDEEVEYAAEQASAKKFIEKQPEGYARLVGEKGSSLSGGQRQRIAIARALVKDPVILITDEATSALDAGSEKKVQEALDRVMENRTSVVVAHRLTTVRNANITYVFDAGEIKEVGTHDELLVKKGYYYDLVRRQLTEEDLKELGEA